MKCEICSSVTGFNYRGRVLCSICIDKGIQSDYVRYQLERQHRPCKQSPRTCEICGNFAVTSIGRSVLCQRCAQVVKTCSHSNIEVTEKLDDNYLVTRRLCCECGLQF